MCKRKPHIEKLTRTGACVWFVQVWYSLWLYPHFAPSQVSFHLSILRQAKSPCYQCKWSFLAKNNLIRQWIIEQGLIYVTIFCSEVTVRWNKVTRNELTMERSDPKPLSVMPSLTEGGRKLGYSQKQNLFTIQWMLCHQGVSKWFP